MVGSSRAGWTSRVPRRSVLALPLVLGIAGCVQTYPSQDDPYIQVLKQEPMFSWKPPMQVSRRVSYYGMYPGDPGEGDKTALEITMTPRSQKDVPALWQALLEAMAQAGYADVEPVWPGRGKRYVIRANGDDFWMECLMMEHYSKFLGVPVGTDYGLVTIELSAPWTLGS